MTKAFKIILLAIFVSIGSNIAKAQRNTAVKPGESFTYVGSFFMSQLWTDLAEVKLKTTETTLQGKKLMKLTGTVQTYTKWDSYFKIADVYSSFVNPINLLPIIFNRKVSEGGYDFSWKYVFKRSAETAKATEVKSDGRTRAFDVPIGKGTFDLISASYNARNIEYQKLPSNTVKGRQIIIDGKLETIYLKYLGTETISVGKYGNKNCYKVAISMKSSDVLKGKDANLIYFTADERRVPVLIKAEIPVGSVQIRLTDMQGV